MDPQKRKSLRLGTFTDLSKVEIGVFWNMAECPIPEGMDIDSVVANITKSLKAEGFNGRVEVYAYDVKSSQEPIYHNPRVIPDDLPSEDPDENLMILLSECLCWAVRTRAPANILLIVGDIEGHDEITRAFDLVTRKQYNCMLAQQVDSEVFHHFAVDKAWTWNTLLSGEPALYHSRLDHDTATSSSPSQGVSGTGTG
uniref:NYN domain-containing protein n=1 Tax=Noccaea caerulescens TaxID=107243 RepID=A0A1J3IFB6_NOCCA